jgi:hypothetical protein
MTDPRVRDIGQVEDIDGQVLIIGVNYHALVLREPGQMGKTWRLESAAAEEFGQLLIAAVWQAAHQQGQMIAEEVPAEAAALVTVPLVCGHATQVPADEAHTTLFWCSGCEYLKSRTASDG